MIVLSGKFDVNQKKAWQIDLVHSKALAVEGLKGFF